MRPSRSRAGYQPNRREALLGAELRAGGPVIHAQYPASADLPTSTCNARGTGGPGPRQDYCGGHPPAAHGSAARLPPAVTRIGSALFSGSERAGAQAGTASAGPRGLWPVGRLS